MHLGLRLLFGFFLVAGLSAFVVLRVVLAEVKPSVREVMEDIMVDTANLLAELAQDDLAALPAGDATADLSGSRFAQRVQDYAQRPIDAQIWGLRKQSLDFRIYVTDVRGRVLLDSGPTPALGEDYSRWRDVALSLRGDYGARSTRISPGDDRSSVMYVAAPVRHQGAIIGVVTVAKPLATVQRFIDRAERRILIAGLALLALSVTLGVAVTLWLVGHVRRLRDYARQVQAGQPQPPPLVPGELGELARAMASMRERLDGREHIEHMVRALTHELKSPLAAMRGAGELLQEELAPADRQRFAGQVVAQSERMGELVERLLELSKLEMQQAPAHPQRLRLDALLDQLLAALQDRLQQQKLSLHWLRKEALSVDGDAELLSLALSNLFSNALDFAPAGSQLTLDLHGSEGQACFTLSDQGPGVPPAAWGQLGSRFFSTARPGSLRKGSGLGLAIVRQVATLHGGSLGFTPGKPGLTVCLRLPLRSD